MDILTPKGIATLKQERRAIELLRSKHPDVAYIHTPKDEPAKIDGVLIKNNAVIAVVETKCRRMDYDTFTRTFENEWLITFDKLLDGRKIARDLRVPFVGMLYLVDSDTLLSQRIADENGDWALPMRIKQTETQKTVNGGVVVRTNAYVKLTNPMVICGE